MTDRKRTLRNVGRDGIGIVYILAILAVWIGTITGFVAVDLSANQESMIDFFVFLFTFSAGWTIFGERAIEAAGNAIGKYRRAKNGRGEP